MDWVRRGLSLALGVQTAILTYFILGVGESGQDPSYIGIAVKSIAGILSGLFMGGMFYLATDRESVNQQELKKEAAFVMQLATDFGERGCIAHR